MKTTQAADVSSTVPAEPLQPGWIVGIDPSLTGTGVCLYPLGFSATTVLRSFSSPAAGSLAERFNRYRKLRNDILAMFTERHILLIAIEGYSMHSKGQAITSICEFGSVLRNALLEAARIHKAPIFEVAPTSLKKFVTGKGNANKTAMIANIIRRWDVDCERTEDEYEAYAMAVLGACLTGRKDTETAAQRSVVDTILAPPVAKRKKKKKDTVT